MCPFLGTRCCAKTPNANCSNLESRPGRFLTTPRTGVPFGISAATQARTPRSWLTAAVWPWAPRWHHADHLCLRVRACVRSSILRSSLKVAKSKIALRKKLLRYQKWALRSPGCSHITLFELKCRLLRNMFTRIYIYIYFERCKLQIFVLYIYIYIYIFSCW
jgi:hypothetical protein